MYGRECLHIMKGGIGLNQTKFDANTTDEGKNCDHA